MGTPNTCHVIGNSEMDLIFWGLIFHLDRKQKKLFVRLVEMSVASEAEKLMGQEKTSGKAPRDLWLLKKIKLDSPGASIQESLQIKPRP